MTLPALTTDHANSSRPSADHLRHEVAELEKMQKQILSDMEALRQQEANLRAYESRLREAHPQSGPVTAGAASGGGRQLDAEWEKFQRSRALLEAERRALCDERMSFRQDVAALKQREEELKRRESWVAIREQALKGKAETPAKKPGAATVLPFAAARDMLTLRRRKQPV